MNLATIERILEIRDHPNADALEIAKIKGWNVVVKKGEFRVGMPCVYVQIDSVLPDRPEFDFLRDKKFKVKPIKLRGQMSQGIAFPLSILPDMAEGVNLMIHEGADVTNILGVTKYEKPLPTGGNQAGPFPSHLVSKTDEERLQNIPEVLEELEGRKIYATIKHDGTSATYIKSDRLYVCSRNWEIEQGENVYWGMALKYKLDKIPKGIAVQGEIVGPKIQNNPEGLTETKFKVFNIIHVLTGKTYGSEFIRKFCEFYKLDKVDDVVLDGVVMDMKGLEELAKNQTYSNGRQAEGIVVRTEPNDYLTNISFKVVNAEYAAKEK